MGRLARQQGVRIDDWADLMPTRYKPKLEHRPLDWSGTWNEIHAGLRTQRRPIWRSLALHEEYGRPGHLSRRDLRDLASDGRELIKEIASVLTRYVMVVAEGGTAPNNLIKANLSAIENDPSLTLRSEVRLEPRTQGILAMNYGRGDEPLGTYWQDVTGDAGGTDPRPEAVRAAARRAGDKVIAETRKGGVSKPQNLLLARELAPIFRRFHDGPIRKRVGPNGTYGPFIDFLNLVLPPVEAALGRHFGHSYLIAREGVLAAVLRQQREEKGVTGTR